MGKIAAVPVLGGIALSAGSRKGRWFIRPSNNRHRRLGHLVAGLLLGGIALPALAIDAVFGNGAWGNSSSWLNVPSSLGSSFYSAGNAQADVISVNNPSCGSACSMLLTTTFGEFYDIRSLTLPDHNLTIGYAGLHVSSDSKLKSLTMKVIGNGYGNLTLRKLGTIDTTLNILEKSSLQYGVIFSESGGTAVIFQQGADVSGLMTVGVGSYNSAGTLVNTAATSFNLTMTNKGTFVQHDQGQLSIYSTPYLANANFATFVNAPGATYDMRNDKGIYASAVTIQNAFFPLISHTARESFLNESTATLIKSAGTGTGVIIPYLTNSGNVVVSSGVLQLARDGKHLDGSRLEAQSGAAMVLSGTHTFSGIVTVNGNVSVENGTVNVGDPLTGGLATLTGGLTVNQNSLLNVISSGKIDIQQMTMSSNKFNMNGTWTNEGTFVDTTTSLSKVQTVYNQNGGSVAVNGTWNMDGSSYFQNTGASTTLTVKGTLNSNGYIYNNTSGINNGITIMPSGSIQLRSSIQSDGGTISIERGGSISARDVTIYGGTLNVDGTLDTPVGGNVSLYSSTLTGTGNIQGNVFISGDVGSMGFIRPGHSPGSLSISGALTLGFGSEIELQIERLGNGGLAWDRVSAGSMFLNGALRFELGHGVSFADLAGLSFLDCGSGCTYGNNFSWQINSAEGQLASDAIFTVDANGVSVGGPALAPVPEPDTYAMLLAGLGLLGFMAYRRKQKAA